MEVRVPDIGDFKDVPIIAVLVKAGDRIEKEQPLVTLESDKATVDVPSPAAGTVSQVRVKVDDRVSEGSVILMLEAAETAAASPAAEEASPAAQSEAPRPPPARDGPRRSEAAEGPRRSAAGAVDCDVLVLGSGPGGYAAAFRAADLRKRVIMVERYKALGGVCLNVGCIPSKALLHVAALMDEARALAAHGVSFGDARIEVEKLRAWKDKVVGRLSGGVSMLAKTRNVEVVTGEGKLTGAHELAVGGRTIRFDQAIIAVAYADGSNTVTLARGTGPSWSSDGTKIAFAAIDYYCDYYYYDCYYYPVGLAVMSADGSGLVFLTNEASDAQPTWSPDGTRIAFISSRNGRSGVYVLNAGVPTLLTNTPRAVSKPAWSPDGTRLAFTCEVDSGNSDICVINANGTGFTRLTSDPGQDAGPAWKPDGSRIAFATTRYAGAYELASMTPDGGDVTRLSPATAASEPAWKPDGTKLVVANLVCGSSSGCSSRGLLVMTAGGTGLTTVSAGADYAPAWRP